MTHIDRFYLVTTYFSLAQPEFNCFKCTEKYQKSYRDKKKFCTIQKSTPVTDYHGVIKYFKCPGNFTNSGYRMVIEAYRRFQDGVLPYTGGYFEQPAKIVEAFELISGLDIEHAEDIKRKTPRATKERINGKQQSKR